MLFRSGEGGDGVKRKKAAKRTSSWHCHHDILWEWDKEPRAKRIAYIKKYKEPSQQALRLRLYRPMSAEARRLLRICDATCAKAEEVCAATWAKADKLCAATCAKARKPLEALHRRECPDCPWNGKTIFP